MKDKLCNDLLIFLSSDFTIKSSETCTVKKLLFYLGLYFGTLMATIMPLSKEEEQFQQP